MSLLLLGGLLTAPPASGATKLTFTPTADTYVRRDRPRRNFGSANRLIADRKPVVHTLLRFVVAGIGNGTVTDATLRLYSVDASPLGGKLYRAANKPWSEDAVTWRNAPRARATPLASFGAVKKKRWYEVDLTSLVKDDGTYSLRLTTAATNAVAFASKEGVGGSAPRLVLTGKAFSGSTGQVVFAAAGDHGANSNTNASLAALDGSGADFYLALGDLDYNETPTDQAWCDYVKARLPTVGPGFPFELVSGNHEDQGGPDGYILNHAACLPDRLGATGRYGAEYFFDYPASAPVVRVIMIAADLTIENELYDYRPGNAHYAWLSGAIDDARAKGVPWVVVGMHENCISAGDKSCSIGADLMNLLIAKKVDLILQGHDHNYQRGKQLALNPATCPGISPGAYDPDCVVDDGSDNAYIKGRGTILVIDGTFGKSLYSVNPGDTEAPYFASSNDSTWGFTKYMVTAASLQARFVPSVGTFTDSFTISS